MPSLELPYDRVESLIFEISLGGKVVPVAKGTGKEIPLFISHCSGVTKLHADLVYEQAYARAIDDGFLTIEETSQVMREKGLFTEEDEAEIERLQSKIEGQEAYLAKLTRVPARMDRTKENIERMRGELYAKLQKKEEGLGLCAERIAQEERYLYITWQGTKDPYTRELFWPTKESFNTEKDIAFRRNVFIENIRLGSGIDVDVLRFLARHNLWRIRYVTSLKTGESLFGVPIPEYSVDQLALAYWSHFYQSVYDMMMDDRPPDSIIEDDAALDAYMKAYMEDQNREAQAARESKQKGKGVKSAWDHGETLVMRSNPLYQDIEYSDTVESIKNKKITDLKAKNPKKR